MAATVLVMAPVIVVFFFLASVVRLLWHAQHDPGFFIRPFYNPATFHPSSIFAGTSVAVLTYIGFDALSTLSEEAENPRRNIMLATVLTCLIVGILSAIEVYVAQLVWPFHFTIRNGADSIQMHQPLVCRGDARTAEAGGGILAPARGRSG